MNSKVSLPVSIEGITVEAEYQGTVYEQTVHVQLNDGTELDLFDGTWQIEENLVGEQAELVVSVQQKGDSSHSFNRSIGVHSAENPVSKWAYEFCGNLVAIDPKNRWFRHDQEHLLVLDIGAGSMIVKPKGSTWRAIETGGLIKGEEICITAARTDVIDVLTGE